MPHVEDLGGRRAAYAEAPIAGTAGWVLASLALAVLLAGAALAQAGPGRAGFELGLQLTARLAFVGFWPCYAAGALTTLFGRRFRALQRRRRALGLAFAAVLAVHLGLVVGLCAIGAPPAARLFLLFGPGVVSALLLAAASTRRAAPAIGPAGRWMLSNLAMNYILFDFFVDFARRVPLTSAKGLSEYLPFALLAAAAPALRLAAAIKLRIG